MGSTDTSNKVFSQALAFIMHTNRHVFLTGKAGTGKTTFLRHVREHCFKKLAVVAPTGVAAVNAGGVTIHSFFQLPFGMYLPTHPSAWGDTDTSIYNENQLLGKMKLPASKRDMIRELDLLIIDEISMVRADLLDAMDAVLRAVRRKPLEPFGGLQVLYIGDLFQLPPVIKEKERHLFGEVYGSPFFFDAKVILAAPPVYLELKKIYRQKDQQFIDMLNGIRCNTATQAELEALNGRYDPDFDASAEQGYITLTTHNYKADAINARHLGELGGKLHRFSSEVSGEFPENAYPASAELELKEGAQVMLIKNDKGEDRKYYNGKIGIIQRIDAHDKNVFVTFPGETSMVELPMETWQNIRFRYNPETDEIEEEELGTFTQFPLRLAWAVTIHKSQGLTFEKAIVDAGASFAAGQVYVALSRLTSLGGLVLKSRISPSNIRTDERIIAFAATEAPEDAIKQALDASEQDFLATEIVKVFEWHKAVEKLAQVTRGGKVLTMADKRQELEWLNHLRESAILQHETAEKFRSQLTRMLAPGKQADHALLLDRTLKAAEWFSAHIEAGILAPVRTRIPEIKKLKAKKYVQRLEEIQLLFMRKRQEITLVPEVARALADGLPTGEVMDRLTAVMKPPAVELPPENSTTHPKEKGASRLLSLELYREGKTIRDIATERNLTDSTIFTHLTSFIVTGEVDVRDLVREENLSSALAALRADPGARISEIRQNLAMTVSYEEIRAASLYLKRIEAQQAASPAGDMGRG
jgi:hypothetical protein